MQYAQIIPNTKTDFDNSIFTYKIPPEILPEINVGSIVKVPFANRHLEGIVFNINRQKPRIAQNKKLKNIEKVLATQPQLTGMQKKLIHWLSKYYYSPLSDVVFSILPSPIQRKNKEKNIEINDPKITSSDLLFKTRFHHYWQLIKKNKKQTILLFPSIEMAEKFYFYFKKIYKTQIALYHASLSKNAKWQTYQKILNQQIKIVIGSQIAIFAPLATIGQIIIDDANSENYKQDQSPRYDVRKVAQKLSKIHKAKLLFSSPIVPLDFYKPIKKKEIKWINLKLNNPKTRLIDLTNEYQNNNYSLLSDLAQQKIIENYKKHKKSILFMNKKGTASLVLCADCGYIFRCPKCTAALTFRLNYNQESKILLCHNCQYKSKEFTKCPKCSGVNLKFLGGGTEKLEREVKTILPNAKIFRLEKEESKNQPANEKNYDILIATQKIFYKYFEQVNLVIAVQPDLNLNLPDFRATEKTFNILKWLKLYSSRDFIIQSYNPKHPVFQAIFKNNDLIFYKNELSVRKKENYPPFSQIVKLFFAHQNQKIAENEAKKLFKKLSKLSNKQFKILGPSPSYYLKKHHKYIWQIILKGQSPYQALEYLPQNWKIDIDPISLL